MQTETVEIGDRSVTLQPPGSFAIRQEILLAAVKNADRAFFAALGACWQSLGRPKAKYARCQYNPLQYGGAVMDELDQRGEDYAQCRAAGVLAWTLISQAQIKPEDLADAEGFTEEQKGVSTSTT